MRALVIGYGSIGERHATILRSIDAIGNIAVLSSQLNLPFATVTSLKEIPELNPDYIVIASSTAKHHEQLSFIEKNLKGKKILVEKPLFDVFYDLEIRNNQVFVGYNLRFHPLLQMIKEKVAGRNLWNVQATCVSYLPEWRPGRDYRETSSAKKRTGGGVLLDLSHELDYVKWLAGRFEVGYVVNEKVSDLEIETDDLLLASGKSDLGAYVQISLNYFTRLPIRKLLIDGEGISIQADLVAGKASVFEEDSLSQYAWPELQRNDTYLAQHKAILDGDYTRVCTYIEGLETMRLIDEIRSIKSQ